MKELLENRKRNGKIKTWIKFKRKKHICRSRTREETTYLASPKRKEGNSPTKDIVFFNEDQSEKKITIKRTVNDRKSKTTEKEQNICRCSIVVHITENSKFVLKR